MATKKSAGYQIDFTTKTLTITKEFSDNAQDPASKEFGILMNLQKACLLYTSPSPRDA